MRTTTFAIALLALSAAGCGDPLFFAEVEEKRICITQLGQPIPAAPAGVGPQSVHWEGDFDLGSNIPGLDTSATTGSLRLVSVSVTGSTDLTGITLADVTITDAAGVATDLVHYEQPPTVSDPRRLDMTVAPNDLLERVRNGGKLHYSFAFEGSPPSTDWTADLETCMYARVMVDALKAIQEK
ncbi:MAG TPA: hypothetical protein VF904_09395 [Anaeromyxobacteraceae bacterium]